MSHSPPMRIKLRPTRPNSWLAKPDGAHATRNVGETPLAILRILKGETYDPKTGVYLDTPANNAGADQPDWWMAPAQADWREAVHEGALVALRLYTDDGSANGASGRWLGVYRVLSATLDEEKIEVAVEPKRLMEILQ